MFFSYLKTGLTTLTDTEIFEIENYTFLWSISGKKWLNEWNMNPNGLESIDTIKPEVLEKLNNIRNKIINRIFMIINNRH